MSWRLGNSIRLRL